jgi:uncharacterized protein (UPF0264 family)
MTDHKTWPRICETPARGPERLARVTGLLVSVRSAAEAAVALEAGADVLDVKEPAHGPLGKADDGVIADVLRAVAGRVPVSVALGELRDGCDDDWRLDNIVPPGASFAKLGLAGCRHWPDWPQRLAVAMSRLPARVTPVAVAYADWQTAGAPPLEEVLRQGGRLGCGAALLDTYEKRCGGLFDHCSAGEVADWIALAQRLGMRAVVAGSLSVQTAARAAAFCPDYIAVRGAACRGGRAGRLDGQRIAALRAVLDSRATELATTWSNRLPAAATDAG